MNPKSTGVLSKVVLIWINFQWYCNSERVQLIFVSISVATGNVSLVIFVGRLCCCIHKRNGKYKFSPKEHK